MPKRTRPRPDEEIVQTTLRIPKSLLDAFQACADDVYQSFNQFAIQAMAQRIRNWESPLTGKKTVEKVRPSKWDHFTCTHGSHGESGVSAAECSHRKKKVHQTQMAYWDGTHRIDGWLPPDELRAEIARRERLAKEEEGNP